MDTKSELTLLKEQAITATYLNDNKKALELINAVLVSEPLSAEFAVEKAEILCKMNDYEGALAVLKEKVYDNPNLIEAELKKIKEEIEYEKLLPRGIKRYITC